MKITHLVAAALMVAGIGVSTEASAQRYDRGYDHDVRYDRGDRGHYDRRDHRRYDHRDNRRWDRRDNRRYGWRGGRNNCRIVYRHHQRYTVCR